MKHHPQIREAQPQIIRIPDVVVSFDRSKQTVSDPTYEEQLLEWIGMVTLDSPRIRPDSVDRYLSRYDLPTPFDAEESTSPTPQTLVRLRWHGFASSQFVLRTWLIPKAGLGDHWFALSAAAFGNTSYTVVCAGGRDVLLWECGQDQCR
jgi:ribonuclease P/MRP protein subunit RPP40